MISFFINQQNVNQLNLMRSNNLSKLLSKKLFEAKFIENIVYLFLFYFGAKSIKKIIDIVILKFQIQISREPTHKNLLIFKILLT